MTNRIAFWLAALIIALIIGDIVLDDARALTFLLRKFADLVEYLAFWR